MYFLYQKWYISLLLFPVKLGVVRLRNLATKTLNFYLFFTCFSVEASLAKKIQI